jgi:hypothetical protein
MMSRTSKTVLILTGVLAASLIIGQLVMGLLILQKGRADLIRPHYHSGLLTVLVSLIYIAISLAMLVSQPAPPPTPPRS